MSLAKSVAEDLGETRFVGSRTYAFVESENKSLARGMKEAVQEFSEEHPKYGEILKGKIEEKRNMREEHLYFGVNEGSRLSGEDYMTVMRNLGISEHKAHLLYPVITEVSRDLQAKRKDSERSVIVGKYSAE